MPKDKISEFLQVLAKGVPDCQNAAVFFARKQSDATYLSCYQDHAVGIPSMREQFQNQSLKPFTWFMPQVYATRDLPPQKRLIISDYDLIPDDAPLKKYYPPSFIAVSDYILWDAGEFVGWIGLLSTQHRIDWEANLDFIVKTVGEHEPFLFAAYKEDFLK